MSVPVTMNLSDLPPLSYPACGMRDLTHSGFPKVALEGSLLNQPQDDTVYKIDNSWKPAVWHQELYLRTAVTGMERRSKREGMCVDV